MKKFEFIICLTTFVILFMVACDSPVNIFSVQQDIDLGTEIDREIESRTEFTVLNETLYSDAYIFLYAMRDELLISPQINYNQKYDWELKIIHDDSVIDAFCAPGGYMYIYTGMLKYLDRVDQLAGLLAHLIAHNDQRQTTASLTAAHGIPKLMSVANKNASAEEINDLIAGINSLIYSKEHEQIADEFAVDYLRISRYACNSTALFFDKLQLGLATSTTFWDAHLTPADRIGKINDRVSLYACSTNLWHDNGDNGDFATMIATLP
jgi:beta-barrel assembly-enhancing protease